jgi:hypothetical protein
MLLIELIASHIFVTPQAHLRAYHQVSLLPHQSFVRATVRTPGLPVTAQGQRSVAGWRIQPSWSHHGSNQRACRGTMECMCSRGNSFLLLAFYNVHAFKQSFIKAQSHFGIDPSYIQKLQDREASMLSMPLRIYRVCMARFVSALVVLHDSFMVAYITIANSIHGC